MSCKRTKSKNKVNYWKKTVEQHVGQKRQKQDFNNEKYKRQNETKGEKVKGETEAKNARINNVKKRSKKEQKRQNHKKGVKNLCLQLL